ncbi:MAG TPA: hypothetical protein DCS67_05315, partial [Clostridiales bacterium UBA8960]|nr:hypothetical protein [Clostridiales bacterium UBA8960]
RLSKHYDETFKKALIEQAENEMQLKELERVNIFKNHVLDTLLKVNNLFMNLNDSDDYYHVILSSAIDVIENASKGSILVFNSESNKYEFVTCVGYTLSELQKVTMTLEETFLYINANGDFRKPLIINNIREFDSKFLDKDSNANIENAGGLDIEEALSAPIIIDDQIIAIMNIDSEIKNAYDETDVQLIQYFASQIAIALKNKYLVDETVNMSRFDRLTGAYSRNYFEKVIATQNESTLTNMTSYALVLCDLNYLKIINDSYGHVAGDAILREFSRMIQMNIRDTDVISRIGGDEFVILLKNITAEKAEEKMDAIFEKTRNHTLQYQGHELPVSFSYGIAVSPDDSMVYEILTKIADIRMYKFKEQFKKDNPQVILSINTF